MAGVGEERRFGAVKGGQGLGLPALFLIGPGVGESGDDLPDEQVQEAQVALVQRAVRVEPDDEHARRSGTTRPQDRQGQGALRRAIPGVPRQVPWKRSVLDHHRPGLFEYVAQRPERLPVFSRMDRPAEVECLLKLPVLARQIRQRERGVVGAYRQTRLHGGEHLALGPGSGQKRRQIPQDPQPAFSDHPFGVLGNDAQHPGNGSGIVGQRTV